MKVKCSKLPLVNADMSSLLRRSTAEKLLTRQNGKKSMLTTVLLMATVNLLNRAFFWQILYKYQLSHSKDKSC